MERYFTRSSWPWSDKVITSADNVSDITFSLTLQCWNWLTFYWLYKTGPGLLNKLITADEAFALEKGMWSCKKTKHKQEVVGSQFLETFAIEDMKMLKRGEGFHAQCHSNDNNHQQGGWLAPHLRRQSDAVQSYSDTLKCFQFVSIALSTISIIWGEKSTQVSQVCHHDSFFLFQSVLGLKSPYLALIQCLKTT